MFSDMFVKLWQQNLFLLGVWQTIYLTVISTVFAYVPACRWVCSCE